MYIVTYLGPKPDSSLPQSLTLGLVYRSGEGSPYWELSSMPLEGILTNCWNESDPWEQNSSEVSNNLTFQELIVNTPFVDELGPITQALSWVEVPQQHERHVSLQAEVMRWKPVRTQ